MVITTTVVGFILLGLGLGFCGWRFLRASRESGHSDAKRNIRLLLSSFLLSMALQNFIFGSGLLFFAQNAQMMYFIFLWVQIHLAVNAVLGVYTMYYIFFPLSSFLPTLSMISILGIAMVVLSIRTYPQLVLMPERLVTQNLPLPLSLITFSSLLIMIGSFTYIFARLFLNSTIREVRYISFVLAFFGIIGVVNMFLHFVLLRVIPIAPGMRVLDIGNGLVGIVVLIFLIITPFVIQKVHNARKRTR